MEKPKIEKKCLTCGKIFFVMPSYSYAKYCSQKCMGEMQSKPKVKKICKYCKKEFGVKPSNKEAKYCSIECRIKWQSKNWAKNRTEKICFYCKKAFTLVPSNIKRGRGKFCSNECSIKWQHENQIKNKIEKICIYCGKIFIVNLSGKNRKFCSTECSGKWRGRNRIKKICEYCEKEFTVGKTQNYLNHCSNACRGKWLSRNSIKKICIICGKEFIVVPSFINQECCSYKCSGKNRTGKKRPPFSEEWRRNLSIAYLKYMEENNFTKIWTKIGRIEPIFEEIVLKQISGLKYEAQKRINKIGVVDFFLSDYGIIIECDEKHHNSPKQKSKDVSRDFLAGFIFKYKYTTIRFTDIEIAEQPKNCIREIKKCIRKKGILSVCA